VTRRFEVFLKASFIYLCSVSAGAATPAQVALAKPALPAVMPIVDCSKLASVDISSSVGAPTHITAATAVNAGAIAPYCDVQGDVEPAIRFEVRLPLTQWTQRYVQTGCGGLCGQLEIRLDKDDGCMPSSHGELALASTDMGHEGQMDGSFGANDYQLRVDFAYRGVHSTALAAKTLIEKFYGQGPKYSYFAGCSDGGREALMEAQRYPSDFNGITAGAPAMNFTTQNTFYHGWNAVVNTDAARQPILTADKLPLVHRAALAQCDAADGLKDGLISDPFACHVDPTAVACKPGQDQAACLTPAQVKVVQEIYAGAHDSDGNKLVLSGPLPGSELAWEGVLIPRPGQRTAMSTIVATGALKNLVYEKNPPPEYTLKDLKFDRETFVATTKLHALYDSTDPDLSPYASAGGKLILWHGLADPHISPLNTVAYFTAIEKVMGESSVNEFARLYLFPGGYHCGDGEGPFEVNLLGAIMAWVENAQAPNELIAKHIPGGLHGPASGVPAGGPPPGRPGMDNNGPPIEALPDGLPPLGQGDDPRLITSGPMTAAPDVAVEPDRTRPVYPYPYLARYVGTGSIDFAKNFIEGERKPVPAAALNWLGSSFYTPHYEAWCTGKGAELSCKQSSK
jgi:hypothetical protein